MHAADAITAAHWKMLQSAATAAKRMASVVCWVSRMAREEGDAVAKAAREETRRVERRMVGF
jgi:hypothetical protein